MLVRQVCLFGFKLNRAISTEQYNNITIDIITKRIEDNTLFDYLDNTIDFMHLKDHISPAERVEFLDYLNRLSNCTVPPDLSVPDEASGLHLLLAYLFEAIQHNQGFAESTLNLQ